MTQLKAERIAQEFNDYMTEWHSYVQPYDDKMDADIHERYARILNEQNKWGYFDFKRKRGSAIIKGAMRKWQFWITLS